MNAVTWLIVAGLLAASSFGAGWRVNGWRYDAERAKELEGLARDRARLVEHQNDASSRVSVFKDTQSARAFATQKEVERVVEKVVYRNQCFDDDGLRILADDIAQLPHPTYGGASAPLPATSAPSR